MAHQTQNTYYVRFAHRRLALRWAYGTTWSGCLLSIAILGMPGEYALKRSLMLPFFHILYDAIIDGLLLSAIYHGFAFTTEVTKKDKSHTRSAARCYRRKSVETFRAAPPYVSMGYFARFSR